MFGKPEITFDARIKIGASIGQDFGYFCWPFCKAPRSEGGGHEANDPDMVFEAELQGDFFSLKAPGYGKQPDYGNGSIHVFAIDGLIIADEDRERVLSHLRSKKQAQIDKAAAALAALEGEYATLSNGDRT